MKTKRRKQLFDNPRRIYRNGPMVVMDIPQISFNTNSKEWIENLNWRLEYNVRNDALPKEIACDETLPKIKKVFKI